MHLKLNERFLCIITVQNSQHHQHDPKTSQCLVLRLSAALQHSKFDKNSLLVCFWTSHLKWCMNCTDVHPQTGFLQYAILPMVCRAGQSKASNSQHPHQHQPGDPKCFVVSPSWYITSTTVIIMQDLQQSSVGTCNWHLIFSKAPVASTYCWNTDVLRYWILPEADFHSVSWNKVSKLCWKSFMFGISEFMIVVLIKFEEQYWYAVIVATMIFLRNLDYSLKDQNQSPIIILGCWHHHRSGCGNLCWACFYVYACEIVVEFS